MSYTVLIPNLISIVLLLILIINIHKVSRNTMSFDTKVFIVMVICNIFQCLGEISAFAIDGNKAPGLRVLNLIINSLLFIVNIGFSVLWIVYSDYKIEENIEKVKKHIKILSIPAIIIIIMSIINVFVPIFFRITSDNEYQRTSLFIIPYIVTYFYLGYGTIFIYMNKRHAKKYVFLPAFLFMLPILAGSLIQFFFYGFSTVWTGVAIALVSVYLNMQNDVSYTDRLSGVYTRMYMYEHLTKLIGRKNEGKKIVGIMVDIDNFKQINDTYGHLLGDEAIYNAGKILHTSSSKSVISRYGGDEFVIIEQVSSEKEIMNILNKIERAEDNFNKSNQKGYSLHFSKGYSIFDYDKDTIDSFLDKMDKAMYIAKKREKEIANK